jgi:ferrous iron transport protein A
MATLDQLKKADRATVVAMAGDPAVVQRLLEMGVMEGEEIEVLAVAPLGDPIEIRCGNSRLSLRRHDAAGIQIRPLGNP